MKTIKLTLTLLPAPFLLFIWIHVSNNLPLETWQIIAWPLVLALVASFCISRFVQLVSER